MSLPIRILCVLSTPDRGGAESMCMNLYRNIDRNKIQFDFVKHTDNVGAFEEEIHTLGGKLYTAPRFKGVNLLQYQAWWKAHLIAHPEYQIIHGHYFTISKYYFTVSKRMHRVTIGHSHTDTYSWKNIGKILMIRNLENYCDYCLACSEKAGKLLYPHKDFTVLRNAIDVEKYSYVPEIAKQVRQEFGILDNEKVVGVIGSFTLVKNPIRVLEIFRAVHAENSNSKLLWCGDGPLRGKIEAWIRDNKLQNSVILAGVRNDIPRMLQGMDVYIMPSLKEGIPVAGIEAQAAGIPCIFSNTVSHEVAITDCCDFVVLDDVEAWKKQVMNSFLSLRKDTRQQVLDAGYDIHKTAEWIQEFYFNILS